MDNLTLSRYLSEYQQNPSAGATGYNPMARQGRTMPMRRASIQPTMPIQRPSLASMLSNTGGAYGYTPQQRSTIQMPRQNTQQAQPLMQRLLGSLFGGNTGRPMPTPTPYTQGVQQAQPMLQQLMQRLLGSLFGGNTGRPMPTPTPYTQGPQISFPNRQGQTPMPYTQFPQISLLNLLGRGRGV